jgi:DNA segregation ATPase FtsK/SpoIIIE, S-DNA-T family
MKKKRKTTPKNYTREATGIIFIGLGIILLLAIFSYDLQDNPNLDIENNSIQIKNWLGPLGAAIADPLMNYTLGYPILILPLIIIYAAFQTYLGNSYTIYLKRIIMMMAWAIILSIILAFPESFKTMGHISVYYPSGLVGAFFASNLVIYLGKFGAILIMLITVLAMSVVTLRVELGKLVSGFGDTFRYVGQKLQSLWLRLEQKRIEQRKEKIRKQKIKMAKREEPVEIKTLSDSRPFRTQQQAKENISPEPKAPQVHIPETAREKTTIKTTLDDILQQAEGGQVDTTSIKKAAEFQKPDVIESSDTPESQDDDFDFEVQEEAKVEEVDYDRLVRESTAKYQFPSVDLLVSPPTEETSVSREELKANAELLEAKLMDFGIQAKVIRVTAGPVITLYEIQPAPGVKVSQIVSLANDVALAMEAKGIRMVAPIPGKAAIGIEIPNRKPQTVYLKPMIMSKAYAEMKHILPLAIGKTINGEVYTADLTKMPHLLIAGSTGSGKSVGINTIIASILYKVDPGKVKFVMIDPKKIELSLYRALSEHYLVWRSDLDEEVITKPSNAVSILNTMVLEMETRYDKLAHLGVRNIEDYNQRVRQGGPRIKEEKLQQLPYIIVIIDELADLMMMAAKEVEPPIARLTQMARAVGIHLILATQRPSVDVITGVIKANFPARIAYMVTTRPDSKTILDMNGAEQLLGNGDMLYQPPGEPRPIRLQNPLVTTEEVEDLIKHIKRQPKFPHYGLPQPRENRSGAYESINGSGGDNLYEDAKRIVVQHQQGSISLLQRRLKIGYSRAARLIDEMEEEGVVGPPDGSKPRQVHYLPEDL